MKFISNSDELTSYINLNIPVLKDIKDISIDSREISDSSLFICIKGQNFDGNDFKNEAIEKGASIVIADRKDISDFDEKIYYVPNTILALRDISKKILSSFSGNIIAITGSNGKTTTTKILKKTLLSASGTIKNFNNEIGMPLSIMKANRNSNHIVLEMGASKMGDIEYLSSIAKPNIGIITNIGNSHLENLENIEGVLKVKSELVQNIRENGYLIVPGDNKKYVDYWKSIRKDIEIITIGLDSTCDIYATKIISEESSSFKIKSTKFNINMDVETDLIGLHNINNILFSYAVSFLVKNDNNYFKKTIEFINKYTTRLNKLKWFNGSTLFDDSYNANPDSVKKSIEFLSSFSGRKILILGDMLELGLNSKEFHKDIGQYAGEKNIDMLIGFGEHTKFSIENFPNNGYFYDTESDLKQFIYNNVKSTDIILLKGSRGMKMERFIDV
jgi:UDP-N-acetylmuramoyl-tripeptide--D-alanyl-D-alanine ligase